MTTGMATAPVRKMRDLTSYDPFRLFRNRLFDVPLFNLLKPFDEALPLTAWTPPCDVYETEKEFVIKAELPGMKKEDVKVSLENDVLTIRGEHKFEEETKRENYHRLERNYGEFLRSFTLPNFVEPEKIDAQFKDGLLTLVLPKREEAKADRKSVV